MSATSREGQLAAVDRLRRMCDKSCARPDERGDIALVLQALSLDPTDPEADHPLIDLYRALVFSARTGDLVYLSFEHRQWLVQGIPLLDRPQVRPE